LPANVDLQRDTSAMLRAHALGLRNPPTAPAWKHS
jgi:hypothetical protein